jgi:hypothetical protein
VPRRRAGIPEPVLGEVLLGLEAAARQAAVLSVFDARARHCEWPGGCDRPPSACDVHHIRHKKDGGPASVADRALFCDFHHDICIHRWGWEIELRADGTITATSPDGQVLRGHPRRPPGPPDRAARPAPPRTPCAGQDAVRWTGASIRSG